MHDMNGTKLDVGDKVTMEFTVTSISSGVEFCNCQLKSTLTMPGNDSHSEYGAVNTKQVLLIKKA